MRLLSGQTVPSPAWLKALAVSAAIFLLALPISVWLFQMPLPQLVPPQHMLTFHTVVEMFAVVVAVLVFAVGYHVLDERRASGSLFLACAFLAVGLLDFMHLMSYPAMPDFITPNTPQQTLIFWLAARFAAAIGILLYVAFPKDSPGHAVDRRLMLAAALGFAAMVFVLGTWFEHWVPALFISGQGLTGTKIAMEWLIIGLHVTTLAVMALRPEARQQPGAALLAGALIVIIGSELMFTLYRELTDSVFVLGHVYKVLAYILIYCGMFLESVRQPVQRLNAIRRAIEVRERRYHQLVETASDGVVVADADGTIRLVNTNLEQLFGYPREALVGRPVSMLVPDAFRPDSMKSLSGAARERLQRTDQGWRFQGRCRDGSEFPVEVSLSSFEDDEGQHLTAFFRDVTARVRDEAQIRHQALHDDLTGLPNRWLFRDRLARALAEARREDRLVALLLLDLDNFKLVNDSLGHQQGDALLKVVAQRLMGLVRPGDTVARLGGDEFVVLYPDVEDQASVALMAERVLDAITTPVSLKDNQQISSHASAGIAMYPRDASDEDMLLRFADMAMYQAKHNGKNTYAFFSQRLALRVSAAQRLQDRLKSTLEQGGFRLEYQPQVSIDDKTIVSMEALLRWQDAELGEVSPARFVPEAEASGLIIALGDWTVQAACRQIRAWHQAGTPVPVSLNLSAMQFRQPDLVDKLRTALFKNQVPPHLLEIEITETVAMEDVTLARTQLRGLRELGVTVALDDFGTGYSSLAYLSALPIGKLKIDRSFVQDCGRNANAETILRAIVNLGQSLELELVAEGVETEQQLRFVRELGCTVYQGWLYSGALPTGEVDELLKSAPVAADNGL